MTRGSIGIGELFGIPVRLHWSLLALVVLWMLLAPSVADGLRAVIMTMMIFGSVLVHELGHALVARRFKVPTREIVLMPLGGIAMLDERPKTPRDELWIAFAGPLTSLALAGLAFVVAQGVRYELLDDLVVVNLLLGVFNLLPAFPLDGGRMLRAGLQMKLGLERATRIAARSGRLIAGAGFVLAIWHHQLLIAFVAVFIYVAGSAEERNQLVQGLVSSKSIFGMMQPVQATLAAGTRLGEALHVMAAQPTLTALPVVFGERVIGIVHRRPMLNAAARQGTDGGISGLVDRNIITHEGDGPLLPLLMRMQEEQSQAAVITEADEVTGIITVELLARTIQEALRGATPFWRGKGA